MGDLSNGVMLNSTVAVGQLVSWSVGQTFPQPDKVNISTCLWLRRTNYIRTNVKYPFTRLLKNITQYFEDIGSLVLRGVILLNSVSVQTSRRNPFSDPDI